MEHYLRDLMVSQRRAGTDCAALVHRSTISAGSQSEQVRIRGQSLQITRVGVWARLLFTPISPAFPLRLTRLIGEYQPDLLHLHLPNPSALWVLVLPAARRIPWVVHWHADVLASTHSLGLRLFYRVYRPLERAVLRGSAAVIATSPPYLESSRPLADFRHKCRVVPLGLDPANLGSPGPVEAGEPQPRLRLLGVGRLTYYKGFQYLIEACSRVPETVLHLVGSGDQEASLKALAEGTRGGTASRISRAFTG